MIRYLFTIKYIPYTALYQLFTASLAYLIRKMSVVLISGEVLLETLLWLVAHAVVMLLTVGSRNV